MMGGAGVERCAGGNGDSADSAHRAARLQSGAPEAQQEFAVIAACVALSVLDSSTTCHHALADLNVGARTNGRLKGPAKDRTAEQ